MIEMRVFLMYKRSRFYKLLLLQMLCWLSINAVKEFTVKLKRQTLCLPEFETLGMKINKKYLSCVRYTKDREIKNFSQFEREVRAVYSYNVLHNAILVEGAYYH